MNCEVEYSFQEDNTILCRKFTGTVKITDIVSSWVETINNYIKPGNVKAIISDFSEVDIQIEISEIRPMEDLFMKYMDLLKNIKIASIVNSPKIVLPMVFKNKHGEFQISPYGSMEAALEWVKF